MPYARGPDPAQHPCGPAASGPLLSFWGEGRWRAVSGRRLQVDNYDTQSAIMLLTQAAPSAVGLSCSVGDFAKPSAVVQPRAGFALTAQVLSYGQVYDRERLDEKKTIVDLLFTACMNPKDPDQIHTRM